MCNEDASPPGWKSVGRKKKKKTYRKKQFSLAVGIIREQKHTGMYSRAPCSTFTSHFTFDRFGAKGIQMQSYYYFCPFFFHVSLFVESTQQDASHSHLNVKHYLWSRGRKDSPKELLTSPPNRPDSESMKYVYPLLNMIISLLLNLHIEGDHVWRMYRTHCLHFWQRQVRRADCDRHNM